MSMYVKFILFHEQLKFSSENNVPASPEQLKINETINNIQRS